VEEDDVEVAERTELAPAVAADGHQRHAVCVAAARLVEEPGQPLVCAAAYARQNASPPRSVRSISS